MTYGNKRRRPGYPSTTTDNGQSAALGYLAGLAASSSFSSGTAYDSGSTYGDTTSCDTSSF